MNALTLLLNEHAGEILRTLIVMELQIALLALIALALESTWRNMSVRLRYAVWLIVLAKCLLPPIVPTPPAARLVETNFLIETIPSSANQSAASTLLSPAAILLFVWLAGSAIMLIVALMNSRLSRHREQICDDFALDNTGIQPQEYGHLLLSLLPKREASHSVLGTATCFF